MCRSQTQVEREHGPRRARDRGGRRPLNAQDCHAASDGDGERGDDENLLHRQIHARNWSRLAVRAVFLTSLMSLATPAGLEPATCRLEGGCSIQLSYGAGPALNMAR
jgi:hypothetical protein